MALRRYLWVIVAVLLVGAVLVLGVGPFEQVAGVTGVTADDANGAVETPVATGTVYTDSGSDGDSSGSGGDGSAADGPPFTFGIDRITKCGQTCRDVTVTLTNQQNTTATDVTVTTRIYAGNSTAKDDLVWSGQQDVGSMAAGESVTRTQRVKLSYMEAYAVKQADGWITVVTTIQSEDSTITFKSRRDVT